MNFFGKTKAKAAPAPTPKPEVVDDDAAVLEKIGESRELIEKRQAHLERKITQATEEAIAYKNAGKKDQALSCLKRKKLMDEELAGLVNKVVQHDVQEHTLRSLKFSAATIEVEKAATAAIQKRIKSIGGADAMEDHRAATDDALEDAYELLGMASQAVAVPGVSQDDEELEEELNNLVAAKEAEDEKLLAQQLTAVHLPGGRDQGGSLGAFPRVPQQEAADLAELDRLEASMASVPRATMRLEQPMTMPMMQGPCMVTVA